MDGHFAIVKVGIVPERVKHTEKEGQDFQEHLVLMKKRYVKR